MAIYLVHYNINCPIYLVLFCKKINLTAGKYLHYGSESWSGAIERSFIFWQDEEKTYEKEVTADGKADI